MICFLTLVVILNLLTGCSGIDKETHEKALAEKANLEMEVAALKADNKTLQEQLDSINEKYNNAQKAIVDKFVLQQTLATTYDAYRYMMVFVTTEVYGNSLTKRAWEAYLNNNNGSVPTFDEIKELINN